MQKAHGRNSPKQPQHLRFCVCNRLPDPSRLASQCPNRCIPAVTVARQRTKPQVRATVCGAIAWTNGTKSTPPNSERGVCHVPKRSDVVRQALPPGSQGVAKAVAELPKGLAMLKSPVSRLVYPDLQAATLSLRTRDEHISRGGKGRV